MMYAQRQQRFANQYVTRCQLFVIGSTILSAVSAFTSMILVLILLVGVHTVAFTDYVAFTSSAYVMLIATCLIAMLCSIGAIAIAIWSAIMLDKAK